MKPFCVVILRYAERIQVMHDLAKQLPSHLMKDNFYEAANWKLHDKELSVHDIRVTIRDRLPSSMHNELEDNQ